MSYVACDYNVACYRHCIINYHNHCSTTLCTVALYTIIVSFYRHIVLQCAH